MNSGDNNISNNVNKLAPQSGSLRKNYIDIGNFIVKQQPETLQGKEVKLNGVVTNIDIEKNEITIKTAKGKIVVELPKNNQLSVGDKVSVQINIDDKMAKLQLTLENKLPTPTAVHQSPNISYKETIADSNIKQYQNIEIGKNFTAIVIDDVNINTTDDINIVPNNARNIVDKNSQISEEIILPQATSPKIQYNDTKTNISTNATENTKNTPPTTTNDISQVKNASNMVNIINATEQATVKANSLPYENSNISKITLKEIEHLQNKIFDISIKNINISKNQNFDKYTPIPNSPPNIDSSDRTQNLITAKFIGKTPTELPILQIKNIQIYNSGNLQNNRVNELSIEAIDTKFILDTKINNLNIDDTINFTAKAMTTVEYAEKLTNNILTQQQISSTSNIQLNKIAENFSTPLFSFSWDSLQEILKIVENLNVQNQSIFTNINNTIPNISSPDKLTAAMLFFISAIKGGKIENWFGKKTLTSLNDLDAKDIVKKIIKEFTNISKQTNEIVNDWRAIPIPLANGDKLEIVQLFIKQYFTDENNSGDDEKNSQNDESNNIKKLRFILNLNLSQIGKIQLDGLVTNKKTLDLFFRTSTKLTPEIKSGIIDAFKIGLDKSGLKEGQIIIQNSPDKFVNIQTTKDFSKNNTEILV